MNCDTEAVVYKKILLATDLTETSNPVNEVAKQLVAQFQAELTLVHTIEPIPAYGYPGITDLESPMIESAKAELAKLGKAMNVPEARQIVEFGSVKSQVLKVAATRGVNLIVIGSHGRHGLSRLLGSSASGIVHGAECDVLTVRCGPE